MRIPKTKKIYKGRVKTRLRIKYKEFYQYTLNAPHMRNVFIQLMNCNMAGGDNVYKYRAIAAYGVGYGIRKKYHPIHDTTRRTSSVIRKALSRLDEHRTMSQKVFKHRRRKIYIQDKRIAEDKGVW